MRVMALLSAGEVEAGQQRPLQPCLHGLTTELRALSTWPRIAAWQGRQGALLPEGGRSQSAGAAGTSGPCRLLPALHDTQFSVASCRIASPAQDAEGPKLGGAALVNHRSLLAQPPQLGHVGHDLHCLASFGSVKRRCPERTWCQCFRKELGKPKHAKTKTDNGSAAPKGLEAKLLSDNGAERRASAGAGVCNGPRGSNQRAPAHGP